MNMTNGEGTRHLPGKIFKPASLEEWVDTVLIAESSTPSAKRL
jgi:hypothetical protein